MNLGGLGSYPLAGVSFLSVSYATKAHTVNLHSRMAVIAHSHLPPPNLHRRLYPRTATQPLLRSPYLIIRRPIRCPVRLLRAPYALPR